MGPLPAILLWPIPTMSGLRVGVRVGVGLPSSCLGRAAETELKTINAKILKTISARIFFIEPQVGVRKLVVRICTFCVNARDKTKEF
jgi:hypothetical protein